MRSKKRGMQVLAIIINLLTLIIISFVLNRYLTGNSIYYIKTLICAVMIIILPGKYIARKLDVTLTSRYTYLIMYILLGMSISFIQYYIWGFVGDFRILYLINTILALIEIYNIIFNRDININVKDLYDIRISILFMMTSCFILYSYINLRIMYHNPAEQSMIAYPQDMLWHMGNINSLSSGVPPMDIRVSGNAFNYHYFSDLFHALCMKVTGIDAENQILVIAPVFIGVLTIGSYYTLAIEFLKRKWMQLIFIAIALGSNVCNIYFLANQKSTESLYLNHIVTNVNSVAYALAGSLMWIIMMIRFIKHEEYSLKYIYKFSIVTSLITFLTTGLKGPFAVVIIASQIIVILICTIFNIKKQIRIPIVFNLITFITLYMTLLSSPAGGGGVEFSLYETLNKSFLKHYLDGILSYILAIPIEFIFLLHAFAIGFIIYGIYFIKNCFNDKDNKFIIDVLVISIIIVGCGGFFLLSQSGLSQMYFIFVTVPFIQIVSFKLVEDNIEITKRSLLMIVGILFIIIGIYSTIYNSFIEFDKRINTNSIHKYPGQGYITNYEYDAMRWIEENTNKDSIFISDRQSLNNGKANDDFLDNRFFYYTAFSNRQCFLEGYSYSNINDETLKNKLNIIENIYDIEFKNRYNLLVENKIKYIVQSHYIHPNLDLEELNIIKCYSNRDITIYEVK